MPLELNDLKQLHDKAYLSAQLTREKGADDLVFYWITQWDDSVLQDSQLSYKGEFNILRKAGRQILADLSMNPVQVDFIPKDGTRDDAADLLDAKFYPLGELDLKIEMNDSTKRKVTEYIRMVDPVIVFTHPHTDYMIDHEITSRLVKMACFAAPIPNYYTYAVLPAPRTKQIPYLYYWSPLDGRDDHGYFVDQSVYVDISDVIDFKAKMLACHKSQRDWLMEQHGMDKYIEVMKNTAKLYGKRADFSFSEGFQQHLGNAYPQDNVLKEILGDIVKKMG